jgi:hypothetical protein
MMPAGERDGGGEIVGVTAATDERGVADAAGSFVEGSAGGGGGGEVAAGVESDGADGIVVLRGVLAGRAEAFGAVLAGRAEAFGTNRRVRRFPIGFIAWESCLRAFVVVEVGGRRSIRAGEGLVGEAGGFAELGLGESLTLAVEDEFGVVDKGHAVGVGEFFGAVADKVDVRTFFENQAGSLNGIAQALDAGYAAGLHASAVHEESIELDTAVGGEKAAAAGVEGGVVFEDGDGGFDSIEGGCAAREKSVAGFKGVADAGQVIGSGFGGDGPCAAVNEKSRGMENGRGHRAIVKHLAEKRGNPTF